MPNKISLWKVSSGQQPIEITSDEISLEEHLEDWLEHKISMLDPGLLVIGRQVRTTFNGLIDLLCLDSAGNIVVVELKKGRTPREVTAQTLDYAAWAAKLTRSQIKEIANSYFGKFSSTLKEKFQAQFGAEDLPDTLNGQHRSIIVAESMDESTERIVEYLSSKGVPINVATVQHFTTGDGMELLARVFLVEPEIADARAQSNNRQLTVSQMANLAEDRGIGKLYSQFRDCVTKIEKMQATVNGLKGCAFQINDGQGRLAAIRLNLADSSSQNGMQFELWTSRLVEHFGLSQESIDAILPESMNPSELDKNWSHSGYFRTAEEVNRFTNGLTEGDRFA